MTASILDRPSRIARFASYVPATDGCHLWAGASNGSGYGTFYVSSKRSPEGRKYVHVMAHRAAWEIANGPIPAGMVIDHLCGVKLCVNPTHLVVTTQSANTKRGDLHNRRKTRCPKGHPYDEIVQWHQKGRGVVTARRCTRCRKDRERNRAR